MGGLLAGAPIWWSRQIGDLFFFGGGGGRCEQVHLYGGAAQRWVGYWQVYLYGGAARWEIFFFGWMEEL